MSKIDAHGAVREATIEAVVIRKDGKRENLGVVSYYHKHPVKRAIWAVKQKLKGSSNGDIRT